jgi:hypothetical protein
MQNKKPRRQRISLANGEGMQRTIHDIPEVFEIAEFVRCGMVICAFSSP